MKSTTKKLSDKTPKVVDLGTRVDSSKLFRFEVMAYSIETTDKGAVCYANLDNAATTPPFRAVEDAVTEYLTSYGSVHRGSGAKSRVSTDEYEAAREYIKRFVNAPSDSYLLLTSNTTGAMNVAAHFFAQLAGKVAVSSIEHSSSWLPWIKAEGMKALGSEQVGIDQLAEVNERIQRLGRDKVVKYSMNDDFEFELSDIERVLAGGDIKVLVLTASSNATGYCPDVKAIGELVHRYGAYFVVDACQFIQHHPIDMQAMGIDFLAASGHKFYAPYGGGFLIGPQKFLDQFLPYEIGGGNLPYITSEGEFLRYETQLAHDPGTPNAVGMIAMAAGLRQLEAIGLQTIEEYETAMTRTVYDRLTAISGVRLLVSPQHLSTVIPFVIEGKDAREVANQLNDRFGIGVRAGSFCVYNVVRQLLDITDETDIIRGVKDGDADVAPGFIRASFSLANTEEDGDRLVEAVAKIAAE